MGLAKGVLVSAICGTLVLSGCSAQSVKLEAAKNPSDCRADWFEERGYKTATPSSDATGFEALVEALLSSFARNTTSTAVANQRYRQCLQSFGVTDTDAYENASRYAGENAPYLQRLPPKRAAYCPSHASVLYGGSGYCVGR